VIVGSLLSAISGQFAKMLILGSLFPVVILSALNILLIAPLLPQTAFLPGLVSKIAVGEDKWQAVVFTLVVFVLTGLLYDLNIPIIRIYEGYPWQGTLLGRGLRYLQTRRFRKAKELDDGSQELLDELTQANQDPLLISDVDDRQTALDLFLVTQMPDQEAFILPTRLGNVIRCFERYSSQAYGMDAIVFWPRLVSKIDPTFASTVDEAKTNFDFMLNLSFLSALTSLAAVIIGLAVKAPLQWSYHLPWLWRAFFFLVLAVLFNQLAINRAQAWGTQVRAAVDLYRLDLLKALGYQQKPLTYQEERAIWSELSSEILYADKEQPLAYDEPVTRIIPSPADITIAAQRQYLPQAPNLRIPVRLRLKNQAAEAVYRLTLIDSLPDGFAYVPDSVRVSSGIVRVRGLAPLELRLGPIVPDGRLTVRYEIRPVAGQAK
jgi:hypothetical protein